MVIRVIRLVSTFMLWCLIICTKSVQEDSHELPFGYEMLKRQKRKPRIGQILKTEYQNGPFLFALLYLFIFANIIGRELSDFLS